MRPSTVDTTRNRAYEAWFFASLEAALGTLMVFTPDEFSSSVFAPMRDMLLPVGIAFLAAAGLLVTLALRPARWPFDSLALAMGSLPLFVLAWNFAAARNASGTASWAFLGVALLCLAMPFGPHVTRSWRRALVEIAAVLQVLLGVVYLLPTSLVGAKSVGTFADWLDLFGPSFLIAGTALFLAERARWRVLLLIALAVSSLNYGAVLLFSAVQNMIWTGMTLYSLMLLVCLAALVPIPRELTISAKLVDLFGVMLGAMVVFGLSMQYLVESTDETMRLLDVSEETVANTNLLTEEILDMQNASRGYLLLGDPGVLATYEKARADLAATSARLARLVASEEAWSDELARANGAIARLDAYAQAQITLTRIDPAAALTNVRSGEGVRLLEDARNDIVTLRSHASNLREQRELAVGAAAGHLHAGLAGATALIVMLGGGLALYLSRTIGARTRALRTSAEATASTADLERAIATVAGGDDLDALARAFERMRLRLRDAFHAQQQQAQELTEAKADAERANRAKSLFLANMSHELRTPLNAVLGFADLLEEQLSNVMNPRQRRFLENIQSSGRHLLALINDVLDLAKVEAEKLELRHEILDLTAVFGPVIEATRADADRAGIAFTASALPAERLRIDPVRTRQIAANLLSNAVKFTPPDGSVEFGVALDGETLVLTVSDTGIGIPEGKRDRVFERFERLNETRSAAAGTGLGLALTKRLVEMHGGTIDFVSAEEAGTTFTVRLPDVLYQPGSSERIVIVENDASAAEFLTTLAHEAGMQTEIARSLQEAQTIIQQSRPLAILLDLYLPDGHGATILEELKSDRETASTPILVVTVETDVARFRLMGADDCLTKPVDPDRIRAWLRAVASRSTVAPAARV